MSKTGLVIPLVGEDGNAFAIMARARKLLKNNGLSDLVDQYTEEATSGDYDHLLAVTLEWFEVEGPKEDACWNCGINPVEWDGYCSECVENEEG